MDTTAGTSGSHQSDPDIAAQEVAVRALLQQLNEAWGDADAYAALYTEDADYVAFDGSHARGRDEIARVHRPLFEGILKSSRLVGVTIPTEVRFLAPDVALVHSGATASSGVPAAPPRRAISIQTLVAVKRGDRWLWAAFQNTRYRPFAQTLLGKILTPRAVQAAQPTEK